MAKSKALPASLTFLVLTAAGNPGPPGAEERLGGERSTAPLLVLKGHADVVWCVRYSPDGKHLATGSDDQTAGLWDAATGRRLRTLEGHAAGVERVAFSPDGLRLAMGGVDGEVRIWQTPTGRLLHALRAHDLFVRALAFNPPGNELASVGLRANPEGTGLAARPQRVKVWTSRTGLTRACLPGQDIVITSLAYSPDGRRLAAADLAGGVAVWETATWKVARKFQGPADLSAVRFSPGGRRLATGGGDGRCVVWDLATGGKLLEVRRVKGPVMDLAFSWDRRRLISVHLLEREREPRSREASRKPETAEVYVWDIGSGRGRLALRAVDLNGGLPGWTYDCALSPDGRRLATAHGDGTVRLWPVAQP